MAMDIASLGNLCMVFVIINFVKAQNLVQVFSSMNEITLPAKYTLKNKEMLA